MTRYGTWTLKLAVAVGSTCALAAIAFAALSSHADMVVRIDAAKGVALIRNCHTGRVMAFKASAEDLANLQVGDEVKTNWKTNTLTEIKNVTRTAALIEPDPIDPCCAVAAVVQDRATLQALLGGVFSSAEANPAEPVNNLRSKVKGVDGVGGVKADFSNILDGADPVNGIIVARNITTGALHVLNASVVDETTSGRVAAAITSSVRIGDKVSIDPVNGIAMLSSQGGLYAFNLRGIKKTADPVNTIKAWVVEPDAKAEGRFGIVRTNWHDKVGSGYQNINVYLPGKTDENEYSNHWVKEHKVMEGDYDILINGMKLEKVPVKAGHATRILIGALHSTAAYATQLHILDAKDQRVNDIQGGEVIALPIGTYHVKVGTRTLNVEIKENQVTDF